MYFIDSKTILDLFPAKEKTAGEKASSSRSEKIFKSGKIISHAVIVSLLINADMIQREIYISKEGRELEIANGSHCFGKCHLLFASIHEHESYGTNQHLNNAAES